jgi:large subunit ribosomal protein L25
MSTTIKAEKRSETGTGAARRLRRAGKIPAILYGDAQPQPITLEAKAFRAVLAGHGSSVVTVSVDGAEEITALIKEIQRDSMKDTVDHVDLQKVSLTEMIKATVPVRLNGEAPGIKMGGVLQHTLWELDVEAQAQNLPEAIEVDISGIEFGEAIHVADLVAPSGVAILNAGDSIVVSVVAPQAIVEEEVEVPVEEEEGVPGEEAAEEAAETES